MLKSIILCHVNVQGFMSKFNEIELFALIENVDIFCLSEHWISNNDIINLNFPNFNLISYCARSTHIHGGSLILAKPGIDCINFDQINKLSVELQIEMCGIIYHTSNKIKIAIITIYRPPTGDLNYLVSKLTEALTIAMAKSDYIIVCGDINLDFNKKVLSTKILIDIFDSFELSVVTNEPTRVVTNRNGQTSSSCIDYVATNIPFEMLKCKVLNPNIADHFAHVVSLLMSDKPNSINTMQVSTRLFNDNNLNELNYHLGRTDWTDLLYLDLNGAFKLFMQNVTWCLNISCPIKTFNKHSEKKSKNGWLTTELIQESEKLKDMFYYTNHVNNEGAKAIYNKRKQEYRKKIKDAKSQYYGNRIINSNNKSKETWKIINEKLGRNKNINKKIVLYHNNNEITDSKEIADLFVDHFSTLAEKKLATHFGANLVLPCSLANNVENSIFFEPVTVSEIKNIISSLKNTKSSGIDELTTQALKHITDNIIKQLVYLFNLSLEVGLFPDILKMASVLPLYKKDDTKNIENYRQISILSILSKILERVVYNRIESFLDKHKVLTDSQHGFRKRKSTETACCHLMEFVYSNLDKSQYVVSLFFDLSAAFDTVNHQFLIDKLYSIGIRDSPLNWIKSYLSGRKMIVKMEDITSEMRDVKLGVPQGSVLGPLLFGIYVNDLPCNITNGRVTMFADDMTITVTANSPEKIQVVVSLVIEELNTWCDRNKLILNNKKTICLNFNLQKPLREDLLSMINIKFSNEFKFLGTFLDKGLTWNTQIEHVCKQLNKGFFAILQLKNVMNEQVLLDAYYSLCYSHISYNITSWGSASEVNRVFIIQKRIVRLIFGLKYRESCRNMFKQKKILTVPSIFILKCITLFTKLKDRFTMLSSSHNYNTRHGDLISIPNHRTSKFKRCFYYNCTVCYNALPNEIRNIKNCRSLIQETKKFLSENVYYSVQEFLHRS